MKLATIRVATGTCAVRVDDTDAVEIDASDVGALLANADWRRIAEQADGARHSIDALDYAPLVPRPDKIVCVGLNYRQHIMEMGHPIPEYPTLFAKYRAALIGAHDPITLPAVSESTDWEGELALIIGERVRNASDAAAERAIAGYAICNDVSVRDYQNRTLQWLQGKSFEGTTPLGPWLVTPDESPGPSRELTTLVDGAVMQQADTADLVFGPVALVQYISQIITLEPGDVISTGTPAGVGTARTPPRFLAHGNRLVTRITGLGEQINPCHQASL
ncbi:MAG: fumarylacetoacetate hydrolase family protein [Acidimicrobiia bacterium]